MPGEEFDIGIVIDLEDNASEGTEQIDKSMKNAEKSADSYRSAVERTQRKITSLKDAQRTLSEEIARAESKYSAAKGKADTYGKGADALRSQMKSLESEHKRVSDAVETVEKKLKQATSGVQGHQTQTQALSSALSDLRAKEKELSQTLSTARERLDNAARKQQEYASAADETATSLRKMREESRQLDNAIQKGTDNLDDYHEKLKQISQTQLSGGSYQPPGASLTAVGQGMQGSGQSIGKVGTALTLGVTTPLVAAGTKAFSLSTGFETSSAKVSTLADTSVMSMEEIEAGIMELSRETGQGPAALTEALYETISATNNTADALAYTRIAAQAAIGGFTDTATAVDGLTTILNSYGQSGEAAMKKVADEMLIAQNYGKTTFGELASSMGQVVPITAQLGIGTDVLMATMATLTKNGIRTSEAVTGLKAALSNIIKPSTEAEKAAERLGIEFSAAALQEKGFIPFLEDLKAKLAAVPESAIAEYSELFGSVEGLNTMMVLTSETGAQDMKNAMDDMTQSAGATQSAYEKMMNTKGGEFQKALNELQIASIEAGDTLAPVIVEVAQSISELAGEFSKLDPGMQETIVKFIALGAAAGPVTKVFGGLVSGGGKVVSLLGKLVSSSKKAQGGVSTLSKGAGLASAGLSGMSKIAGKLPGILGLTAAGLTVAGIAMSEFHKKCLQDDLDEHFGDLHLSMEEVEDVAKRLTTNDWTDQIDKVTESRDAVESLRSELDAIQNDLAKTEWKASIGLALTGAEEDAYQENIGSFVEQAKDYAEQDGSTVSLAIGAIFEPDSTASENAQKIADSYYAGLSKELEMLGESLAMTVNEAFNDHILSDAEIKVIQKKQQEIIKLTQETEQARSNIRMQNLAADAVRGGLDSESFSNLITQLSSEISARKISVDNAVVDVLTPAQAQLAKGEISQTEYDQLAASARLNASQNMGNTVASSLSVGVDTLTANYGSEIEAIQGSFDSSFQDALSSYMDDAKLKNSLAAITAPIANVGNLKNKGVTMLEGDSAENMRMFLEQMRPLTDELESYAEEWLKAGQAVPQEFVKGLEETFRTEVMAGDMTHYLEYAGMQLGQDPKYLDMLEDIQKSGAKIPEALLKGVEMASGKIFDEEDSIFKDAEIPAPKMGDIPNAEEVAQNSHDEMQTVFDKNPLVPKVSMPQTPSISANASVSPEKHAAGGMVQGKTLSWLAEEGYPEVVIPLNPARRNRALSLWEQTGAMLGAGPQGYAEGGFAGNIIGFPQRTSYSGLGAAAAPSGDAVSSSAGAVSVQVEAGAVQITVQASGGSPQDIVAAVRDASDEITEIVVQKIADGIQQEYENRPIAKGA